MNNGGTLLPYTLLNGWCSHYTTSHYNLCTVHYMGQGASTTILDKKAESKLHKFRDHSLVSYHVTLDLKFAFHRTLCDGSNF